MILVVVWLEEEVISVIFRLCVKERLKLSTVQKDPAAVQAAVKHHSTSFNPLHFTGALGAG